LMPGKELEEIECQLKPEFLRPRFTADTNSTDPLDTKDCEQRYISYEALSYCWGDTTIKTPIICNGARLDVTQSLKVALQHLRNEKEVRVLWIDAICINQSDLIEREQQVENMREIYEKAVRILVWLGEAVDDSLVALSFCARMAVIDLHDKHDLRHKEPNHRPVLGSRARKHRWNSRRTRKVAAAFLGLASEPSPGNADRVSERDFIKAINEKYVSIDGQRAGTEYRTLRAELFALQVLLRRPWFTRMWIAQEIGVAKEALLVCGKITLSWSLFEYGFRCINSNKEARSLSSDIITNGITKLIFLRLCVAHKGEPKHEAEKLLSLLFLLINFRGHRATDPKDKVFALYGLTSSNLSVLNLRPDYHSSTENVYKHVALTLIQRSANLDILSSHAATRT